MYYVWTCVSLTGRCTGRHETNQKQMHRWLPYSLITFCFFYKPVADASLVSVPSRKNSAKSF